MCQKVDLHLHSHYSSDGFHSPEKLFRMAQKKRMEAIVIADHDTLACVPETVVLSQKFGIRTLPSLELSTISDNRMVHILAYGVPYEGSSYLKTLLEKLHTSRLEILPQIKANLEGYGFAVNMQKVNELAAPGVPVITNFATAVIQDESNMNHPDLRPYQPGGEKAAHPFGSFVKEYLVAGAKGYVPEYLIDINDGIAAIRQVGGVPVLAHPGEWFGEAEEKMLPRLIEEGLQGIEVYTPYHSPEKQAYFAELARRYRLLATGGSDYHSQRFKPGHEMGKIAKSDISMLNELVARSGYTGAFYG